MLPGDRLVAHQGFGSLLTGTHGSPEDGAPAEAGVGDGPRRSDDVSGGGGAPVAEVAMRKRAGRRRVKEPGLGDLFGLRVARKTVKGFDGKTDRPRFYNVWLDK